MDSKKMNVLLIEDSPGDAKLISMALRDVADRPFRLEHAETLAKGLTRLNEGGISAVLLDLSLPDSLGLATLTKARAHSGNVPIIVMTGLNDDLIALKAVHHGAQDYLVKGSVTPENLARSLRYAIERQALSRLRQEYIHNVNHELRTPLTAIYGALDLLRERMAKDAAQQHLGLLSVALRGVEHLIAMSNDLSDVLRAETGKIRLTPIKTIVADILNPLTELLGKSEEARRLTLTAVLMGDIPPVCADPVRLKQILINLIGNAIKFTPSGSITVRAKVWDSDASFVCISVTDTGRGIETEAMKSLFEYYYQASSSGASSRGLGIGLYLCRELVTRHGGTIWVESTVNKGSTFYFTLPIFREAA